MVVNTVTVARISNRSVRERKSDVLLVVPDGDSQALLLGNIARRMIRLWYLSTWYTTEPPDPNGDGQVAGRVLVVDPSSSHG